MSRRRPDARTWARLDCRRISPRGVIVPHRNRTRGLGGLLCAFYNGRDARCASCGRDARHPDNGQDARCPCCAAKMAAFPVRARQARPLPWRRSRGDRPTWRSGCSLRGTSHIRISEVARDQPGGVIVPNRNRTRVLVSGRFCLRPAVGCDRMCSVE